MIYLTQLEQWRREYLQEMRDVLSRAEARNNELLKRLNSSLEDMGGEFFTGDDFLLLRFTTIKFEPIIEVLLFLLCNNPIEDKSFDPDQGNLPRYPLSMIFDYISNLTNLGKYRVTNKLPIEDDDVFFEISDSIFNNDKARFLETVNTKKIDFTDFRRKISCAIFTLDYAKRSGETIMQACHELLDNEDETKADELMESFGQGYALFTELMPKTAIGYTETAEKELSEQNKQLVDKSFTDRLHRISRLYFDDDDNHWQWDLFITVAFWYSYFDKLTPFLTDDELKVINDFLNDTDTNHFLSGVCRYIYVSSKGDYLPQMLFVPQSVRDEVNSGVLNEFISEMHPDRAFICPDIQEQTELTSINSQTRVEDVVRKKRSLDDFDFIKQAHLNELYLRIEEAVSLYDENRLSLFCATSRRPLERALKEVYQIAGIKKIPDYVGDRIGNLPYLFPDELVPKSIHQSLSLYNKLVRKYNHDDTFPTNREQWNEDAEECYRLMYICFKWVASFRETHDKFFETHDPIDYEQKLIDRFLDTSDLPKFNSVEYTQMPDFDSQSLIALNEEKRYKEALESSMSSIFQSVFEKNLQTFDNTIGLLEGIGVSDEDAQKSLSYLDNVRLFLPKLVATRHIYSYFCVLHPILFCESWSPDEIANAEFSGVKLDLKSVFWGLKSITLYASKCVVRKLSVDEQARNNLCSILDNRDSSRAVKSFFSAFNKLPEDDQQILQNLANFRRFINIRDRKLLFDAKDKAFHILSSRKDKRVNLDYCVIEFCKSITRIISDILAELVKADKCENWPKYELFEQKYVQDILADPIAQPYLAEFGKQRGGEKHSAIGTPSPAGALSESSRSDSIPMNLYSADKIEYYYVLPSDLFSGKVDISYDFIPGLKNLLKNVEAFELLFNYILRLGGICSDKEAGALLRAFTGYPVDGAYERAKWKTDYHILYYLVKHMFAAKGTYAKMMECIDITYPSEAERIKAEKAPSSYADRVSGADASSILETLSRLSKVF